MSGLLLLEKFLSCKWKSVASSKSRRQWLQRYNEWPVYFITSNNRREGESSHSRLPPKNSPSNLHYVVLAVFLCCKSVEGEQREKGLWPGSCLENWSCLLWGWSGSHEKRWSAASQKEEHLQEIQASWPVSEALGSRQGLFELCDEGKSQADSAEVICYFKQKSELDTWRGANKDKWPCYMARVRKLRVIVFWNRKLKTPGWERTSCPRHNIKKIIRWFHGKELSHLIWFLPEQFSPNKVPQTSAGFLLSELL